MQLKFHRKLDRKKYKIPTNVWCSDRKGDKFSLYKVIDAYVSIDSEKEHKDSPHYPLVITIIAEYIKGLESIMYPDMFINQSEHICSFEIGNIDLYPDTPKIRKLLIEYQEKVQRQKEALRPFIENLNKYGLWERFNKD